MNDASCTTRAARSTREEAAVFARLADTAADGYYSLLCGPRYKEIIAEAYLLPSNEFSHEFVVFAEQAGQIVGMASAYTAEQYQEFDHGILRRLAGAGAWRVALMEAVLFPVVSFLHKYEPGDFYLNLLAVEEERRGNGVGAFLIDTLKNVGRECGSTQCTLAVLSRNQGAQRLYQRSGFSVEAQWPRNGLVRPQILRFAHRL